MRCIAVVTGSFLLTSSFLATDACADPHAQAETALPKVKIDQVPVTPKSMYVLMDDGQGKPYKARLSALKALRTPLSREEIHSLYSLMNRKNGEDELRADELNALKDCVCTFLEKQKEANDTLAHNLMAMYCDKGHDKVWRDYCVQHLGSYLSKINEPSEQKKVVDLFRRATEEKDLTVAGTSLIAMSRNLDNQFIDKDAVADKAYELAIDPSCGDPTRITALQICARLDEKRILETARQIAVSKGSVQLRMSAIAAIGTLGGGSDRELLEHYAGSSDVRLRKSAQSALARLEQSDKNNISLSQ